MAINSVASSFVLQLWTPVFPSLRSESARALLGQSDNVGPGQGTHRVGRAAANVQTLIAGGVALGLGRFIDLRV